jgi:hypothetical protein
MGAIRRHVGALAVGLVTCAYRGKPLTASGAIEADLVYSDDSDGKDYLLRTFKLTVARFPGAGEPVWQVVPDDVLGAAWVRHWFPQELHDAQAGRPHFYFWIAARLQSQLRLRCTVDSTELPDIKLTTEIDGHIEVPAQSRTGERLTYEWTALDATADIYFGQRSDFSGARAEQAIFLGEHPGAWRCAVHADGESIRELAFMVTDHGFITSDLETARGAPMTFDTVAAIELRFPRGAQIDGRIRPDAMKNSRNFGLPWPDAPSVKAIQATFPAASGWPDPK